MTLTTDAVSPDPAPVPDASVTASIDAPQITHVSCRTRIILLFAAIGLYALVALITVRRTIIYSVSPTHTLRAVSSLHPVLPASLTFSAMALFLAAALALLWRTLRPQLASVEDISRFLVLAAALASGCLAAGAILDILGLPTTSSDLALPLTFSLSLTPLDVVIPGLAILLGFYAVRLARPLALRASRASLALLPGLLLATSPLLTVPGHPSPFGVLPSPLVITVGCIIDAGILIILLRLGKMRHLPRLSTPAVVVTLTYIGMLFAVAGLDIVLR